MILTQKTERVLKKIEKALLAENFTLEILGNQVLTENCTIEVWKGEISVNEKSVKDVDCMLHEVLSIERGMINEALSMDVLKSDDKFRYMMLSRLKSDCDYYLGYGNRSSNNLWAKDENEQIETMKALHNSFDKNEKPEWLTWEQISDYERQMLSTT